jgi:hypothetical protein
MELKSEVQNFGARALKGVHNVAKTCSKILATLKPRGKNFGDMYFDVFR